MNNTKVGIFSEQERNIQEEFCRRFGKQLEVYNQLLGVYENFLDATAGKIKDTDRPNWTILLFLSQTLPLMNNAVDLLSKGYLRSSESFVRVVGEAIILSVIFKEYPEIENEYYTLNHNAFFRKYRLQEQLKRVQEDGKYFSLKGQKDNLYRIIYTNLYGESNRFLHPTPKTIYGVMKSYRVGKTDKHVFVKGPQLYPERILKVAFRRLFNAVLFSLVVLGVSLNIFPDKKEREIMDEASNISNSLNLNPTRPDEVAPNPKSG